MAKWESRCRVCGCTDSNACADGCSWVWVDRDAGIGVCSSCELADAMACADEFLREYAEILANSYKVRGRWLKDAESQVNKENHDQMLAAAKLLRAAVKGHKRKLRHG